MQLLIKNGCILTSSGEFTGDILVEDEKIAAIGSDLKQTADKVIDASGMYILPGGVDQHTHYAGLNTDGVTLSAGYETSYGALIGGTTTLVEFAANEPGMGIIESLDYRKNVRAKGKVSPDFAMHALCTNIRPDLCDEIEKLPEYGVSTLKLFMAYKPTALYTDDGVLFKAMRAAAKVGVTMYVHAENADLLNLLRDEEFEQGHTEPCYHYQTRPPFVEAEAVQRAIILAKAAKCPLCVVHVTCKEAAEIIREERLRGAPVVGETCTHYLVLDQKRMDDPDFMVASRYVCSPALRTQEHRDYLWRALAKGDLDIVASDHSGIPLTQKIWGKDDFRKIPNGCPGTGDRLQMLWTYGVETGKITRQRLVEIFSEIPAKMNGIFPRKGILQVGSDADIVLYDPRYRGICTLETNPSGVEYNLFEGMEQIGRVETVLLRGNVVVENNKYVGVPGYGQFIPGKAYGMAYDLL